MLQPAAVGRRAAGRGLAQGGSPAPFCPRGARRGAPTFTACACRARAPGLPARV